MGTSGVAHTKTEPAIGVALFALLSSYLIPVHSYSISVFTPM